MTPIALFWCNLQFVSGFGGLLGFSVISPTYDRSFDPPAFLGVSGVDYAVQVCTL